MEALERFKETILNEYPRMAMDDTFQFACHKNISCFNHCCRDVNIFLTPYDILRMTQALNMDSGDFLERYTLMPIDKNQRYPVVMLMMQDDEEKRCPFVTEAGCGIYNDRPWACRMYPVGLASPKDGSSDEEFHFLLKEEICKGLEEPKQWTLREWIADQGIDQYNTFGELFKPIALHDWFKEGKPLSPQQIEMFYMVCYNQDGFRRFVFNTTFLDRFDLEPDLVEQLKTDKEALLKFGFDWLRFCLFKEPTLKVKNPPAAQPAPKPE